ncbi:MAG: MauE/DoxX family redox-associated membrane protein [Patescibacteria group bacterium]
MNNNNDNQDKIAPEGYHYMSDGTLMQNHKMSSKVDISTKYKLADYAPLILVIGIIFLLSLVLTQFFIPNNSLNIVHDMSKMGNMFHDSWIMRFMDNIMGIWFIIFALFKLIDLKGFAEGYSTYDIIAKKFKLWGFVYPFIEIGLGIAYLTRFIPTFTNLTTLILLSIASIGIMISIVKKRKIQCACLGTVLKVPLTTVSLIENIVMALMALVMVIIM